MKDEQWIEYFKNFGERENKIVSYYLDNEMFKLKILVSKYKPNSKDGNCKDPDLYDDAIKVLLESLSTYDWKTSKFDTYFTNNLKNSFTDWYRDNYLRAKRYPLETDANGKILKDENGKPIQKPIISLNAPINKEDEDIS